MIKFSIIKYTDVTKEKLPIPPKKQIYAKSGVVDCLNLSDSSFSKYLAFIPRSAQKELDEKGSTEFTVTTKRLVRMEK